ncbi:hypothetical protein BDQ17DRAFT_1335670 [Cyathus striatus]|nr:hypothetical protein BDQ17DRAFT_1335670 [Cyathus striatus]
MSNDERPSVGSIPNPIQTGHRTRIAEQVHQIINDCCPPIDAGDPYCPVPPRLQSKTKLAGEQITGAGPPIDPSHLYHPVPPRLHGRTQSVKQTNTTGCHFTHIQVEQEPSSPNELAPGQAEVAQGALLNLQGPRLGTSGPPPCQSLSLAPSLITSSMPIHALLPPSPLPGTSAAFFSGNPAQPSEVGVLVHII